MRLFKTLIQSKSKQTLGTGLVLLSWFWSMPSNAQDSLTQQDRTPRTVDEVWAEYDPKTEPLETRVVRQWENDGVFFRYVTFLTGRFHDTKATLAAFYAFPKNKPDKRLPGLIHYHGGGQRASIREVTRFAQRGYAVLSINWGGREMEGAKPNEANTDWGAVDPTQENVPGYSSLLPGKNRIDPFPSARNNNWFLLAIAGRRAITFMEKQPEVDPERIGVYGHSMGGRLTGLVAGSDRRVKVASPSVGGSGFLQTDFWGLPNTRRRVRGDLGLFQSTIAGEAYLQRVRCPFLFLSSTNDFNAPMEFVEKGMKLIDHENKRTVYAPHLNHRFTPETDFSRALWFDSHLKSSIRFPETPKIKINLEEDREPGVIVEPDLSREIERVDIYYGYGRDPRNRFWADGKAKMRVSPLSRVWTASTPVFDLNEPLFVLANVYYRLSVNERKKTDPNRFVISVADVRYPADLKQALVKPMQARKKLIDDFSRGWQDWYVLQQKNPYHWFYSTRKLADPRWQLPGKAKLGFEVRTTQSKNVLGIQVRTNQWRNYLGKKFETWTALVAIDKPGSQDISLSTSDFQNQKGEKLKDWQGITELIFRAGDRADDPRSKKLVPWKGAIPVFGDLHWNDN